MTASPNLISISRETLSAVIVRLYPDPNRDEVGPWWGPIAYTPDRIRSVLFGEPRPIPWRSGAWVAREAITAIAEAQSQVRQISVLVPETDQSRATSAVANALMRMVEDWCPTGKPVPVPYPGPRPLDQLLAGALFVQAASLAHDPALNDLFGRAAERLFEAGFREIAAS